MVAEHAYVSGMSPLMTAEELLHTSLPDKRADRRTTREYHGDPHDCSLGSIL